MVDWSIDFGVSAFHIGMKILGPCLICLALSLISFVTYTYFVHALPQMEETVGFSGQCSLTSLGCFLLTNTIYNYGKSICSDPGLPPEFEKAQAELATDSEELAEAPPRQCSRCSRLKPPRCHHCSVCRRCVLKMDHHCPWINNCVGFGNYRQFCLFLLFLALSCSFILFVFFQSFSDILLHSRRRRGTRASRQCIMTSFMICGSILLALCILGGFHVYLVLTNQTTIEFQYNIMRRKEARKNGEYFRNPYDLGRTRNFQQVFGPNSFCRFRWLLSWSAPGPSGDGLYYPSLRTI